MSASMRASVNCSVEREASLPKPVTLEEELKLVRGKNGMSVFARRKSKKVTNLDDLIPSELAFAKTYAATLKAVGFSWRYISDTVNIQTGLVKAWADDPEWMTMVEKVAQDVVDGAAVQLRSNTVELQEMLMEVARKCPDWAVKLRAIESGLDRTGLSKVNKSESVVTKNEKTTHTLASDLFERMEGLPFETQQKLAAMATEMEEMMETARGQE